MFLTFKFRFDICHVVSMWWSLKCGPVFQGVNTQKVYFFHSIGNVCIKEKKVQISLYSIVNICILLNIEKMPELCKVTEEIVLKHLVILCCLF